MRSASTIYAVAGNQNRGQATPELRGDNRDLVRQVGIPHAYGRDAPRELDRIPRTEEGLYRSSSRALLLGASPCHLRKHGRVTAWGWSVVGGSCPYLRSSIAALRPKAAGWLSPTIGYILDSPLLDLTPVTRTVHYWLWEDLECAKWTERINPWVV